MNGLYWSVAVITVILRVNSARHMACDWVRLQKWRTHERVDVQEEV